ncbi:alpha/beta fold hydrolase [Shewanella halotolerans]|uniref:alpha/beta fold hydrolase n=1 Tax=Shewanella halotolerans TaxID=2864204 RepID=UPI001C65E3CF|nr:alpha/beta hydrolase [Shewanella halotolerans]QYJ91059.1 alpha/beta fold hydrolase [Shewanella halotolerans]
MFSVSTLIQESRFIPYRQGQLHLRLLKRPDADMSRPPILMLHGAMSNGRVFYSDKGRGLGCYLAEAGFVVYVLDTLGRGLSTPKLSTGASHGQGEVIREQLPLVQHYILSQHPEAHKVHWCAHSWGGVLMASAIARFDFFQTSVASLLTFGSKRAIKVRSFKKWLMVDLVWNKLAPAIAAGHGYLAADRWRMGMDNETKASLSQSIDWVRGEWIDHDDGFDYAKAASALGAKQGWPKTWFIAGKGDQVLGNPADVQRMIKECHIKPVTYTLLSKANGNRHDYGHAEMLTHKDATEDHFPLVLSWYRGL